MIDALILAAFPALLFATWAWGELDARRFRASLPRPRTAVEAVYVPPAPLPAWAASPGPAQWSSIAGRPGPPPARVTFQDPPPPVFERIAAPTPLSDTAAAIPDVEAPYVTGSVVLDLAELDRAYRAELAPA